MVTLTAGVCRIHTRVHDRDGQIGAMPKLFAYKVYVMRFLGGFR